MFTVPRLHGGRLSQVTCRKESWGCFGGRHFLLLFGVGKFRDIFQVIRAEKEQ